jgi:malonyl CoA-acyl carrier protein transacylase
MQNKLAFVFPGQGSQTVGMLGDYQANEKFIFTGIIIKQTK